MICEEFFWTLRISVFSNKFQPHFENAISFQKFLMNEKRWGLIYKKILVCVFLSSYFCFKMFDWMKAIFNELSNFLEQLSTYHVSKVVIFDVMIYE